MFTWICPQCGREVPPSYSECPTCLENRQRAAGAAPPPPLPPYPPPSSQQPQYAQPPAQPQQAGYMPPPGTYAPPPQPQPQRAAAPLPPPPVAPPPPPSPRQVNEPLLFAPPQPYAQPMPEHKPGIPGWLATVLIAAVLVGLGAVVYLYVLPSSRNGGSSTAATSKEEAASPSSAAAADTAATNRYAKYLEVTGLRIVEKNNKAELRCTVVNHAGGELADLKLRVTVVAGDNALGSALIEVDRLSPYESKDFSAPLPTKARAYELPDWQFLKATFEVVP